MSICSEGDVITPEHSYADILNTAVMGFTTGQNPYVVGISGIRELPHGEPTIAQYNITAKITGKILLEITEGQM